MKFYILLRLPASSPVTPCMGVWIEMSMIAPKDPLNMSLPVWECGLKWYNRQLTLPIYLSLPVWECGLKSVEYQPMDLHPLSLPVWECGLKLSV